MMSDESLDARLDLASLPQLAPDAARDARRRARCHAVIDRRRPRAEPAAQGGAVKRRLAAAVIGGFWVLYVLYVGGLVATTIRLEGFLG